MFIRAFYTESQNKTKIVQGLRETVKKNKKELRLKDKQIAALQKKLDRHSMSDSLTSCSQTISDSIINQQAAQINELQAKLQKYELMILNQLETEVEMEEEELSHSLTSSASSMESDDAQNAESDDIEEVIASCQDSMRHILDGIKTPYHQDMLSK